MKAFRLVVALATLGWGGYAAAEDDEASLQQEETSTVQPWAPEKSEKRVEVREETVRTEKGKGIFAPGDNRGLSVMLGGGVEGYSGDLAPQIAAGPTWGVTAQLKPTRALGFEVGYSGAVNEIRTDSSLGAVRGVDLVRNGGQLAATVALTPTMIQPYLMGGIGVSRYSARGDDVPGFRDDTVGHIPVGGGLRAELGRFAADARFGYNVLFDQQFAATVPERKIAGIDSTSGARYAGTLNLGAAF